MREKMRHYVGNDYQKSRLEKGATYPEILYQIIEYTQSFRVLTILYIG